MLKILTWVIDLIYILHKKDQKANSISKKNRAPVLICNLHFTTFPGDDVLVEKS